MLTALVLVRTSNSRPVDRSQHWRVDLRRQWLLRDVAASWRRGRHQDTRAHQSSSLHFITTLSTLSLLQAVCVTQTVAEIAQSTSAYSALGALAIMCYTNLRFTNLLLPASSDLDRVLYSAAAPMQCSDPCSKPLHSPDTLVISVACIKYLYGSSCCCDLGLLLASLSVDSSGSGGGGWFW